MLLSEALPTLPYYAVRLEHLPQWWILGGACFICRHEAPVDRWHLERRYGKHALVHDLDHLLVCAKCQNRHHNRFVVTGKERR